MFTNRLNYTETFFFAYFNRPFLNDAGLLKSNLANKKSPK
jgi:hypothetical protein